MLEHNCLLCGATAVQPLCPACAGMLPHFFETCPVCAIPSGGSRTCGRCLAHPPHFDRTVAAWAYAFPVDRLVQSLKFHHRLDLAPWLAEVLSRRIELPDAAVVCVPLHASRLARRGFNQSLEIARHYAVATNGEFHPFAIEKHRRTPPQAELPLKERVKNARGAYRCKEAFSGRTVAVIDDVMTTGASLNEIARILKIAGASSVVNVVVARTPPIEYW